MKRYKQIIGIALLLAAMTFAFIGGFEYRSVAASNRPPHQMLFAFAALPEQALFDARPSSNGSRKTLQPSEAYFDALTWLKENYYGKVPARIAGPDKSRIDDKKLTYDAIRGMMHALGDRFTRFLDPEDHRIMREESRGDFVGIGAQLTMENNEVVIAKPLANSPAWTAGLKAKDVITAVDGKPVKGLDLTEVVKRIRGERGTKVRLAIRREGTPRPLELSIKRDTVQFVYEEHQMLPNNIGYIALHQFSEQIDSQLDKALADLEVKGVKALILDLRDNPGGLLDAAREVGSRFIPKGKAVVKIQDRGARMSDLTVMENKHNHKEYPLAVLINGQSASASEIVAGAIKDNSVGTLVGEKTFGKGLVQTIISLRDGSAVAITTQKYFTSGGVDINKKGIEPDIKVEQPTDALLLTDPEGTLEKDVQAKTAFDFLRQKLSKSDTASR
ncbi:MAG: S41 family peptidase [Armatimonadetes bacterium]|nr:S41 family peptidase [Armatimonadota bacterium]